MNTAFASIATRHERRALADAIAHNCDCHTQDGRRMICASHRLVLEDEQTLRRLLYVRRALLPTICAQEFAT
jgi:hypothetical protein